MLLSACSSWASSSASSSRLLSWKSSNSLRSSFNLGEGGRRGREGGRERGEGGRKEGEGGRGERQV